MYLLVQDGVATLSPTDQLERNCRQEWSTTLRIDGTYVQYALQYSYVTGAHHSTCNMT